MSRSKKIFCDQLLYCVKLYDRGKLKTREDTCSQAKNVKVIDFKVDLKKVLVDSLDGWDYGKASTRSQYR